MVRFGLLTFLAIGAALPASAQQEEAALFSHLDHSSAPPTAVTPLTLALSLAFDSTTWAQVGVSTSAPAADIAELLARGYYRLEVLQLTLLAKASGKRLLDMRTRRTKDGLSLRKLAEEAKVSYDVILDEAHILAEGVDARIKDLESVRSIRPPEGKP